MDIQFSLARYPQLSPEQIEMAQRISTMNKSEYQAFLNALMEAKFDINQIVWWVQLARGIQLDQSFTNRVLVVSRIKFFVISKKFIDSDVFDQYMNLK
jgi:hypothetical protein